MEETPEKIVVDPQKYGDLDASWGKETWVDVALKALSSVRHQTAAISVLAIVGLLWKIGVRPQDTVVLSFAIGCISVIAVSEVWIDRHDDNKGRKSKT